jgi:hypothetical protein
VSNQRRGGSHARDKGVDSLIKKSRVSRVWCQRQSQRYGIIEIKCRGNVSQKSLTLVRGIVEETSEGPSVVRMSKKKRRSFGRYVRRRNVRRYVRRRNVQKRGRSVHCRNVRRYVCRRNVQKRGRSVRHWNVQKRGGTSVVGMSKGGEGTSVVGMAGHSGGRKGRGFLDTVVFVTFSRECRSDAVSDIVAFVAFKGVGGSRVSPGNRVPIRNSDTVAVIVL